MTDNPTTTNQPAKPKGVQLGVDGDIICGVRVGEPIRLGMRALCPLEPGHGGDCVEERPAAAAAVTAARRPPHVDAEIAGMLVRSGEAR